MKPKVYLIVATDPKGGMGLKGKLPWNLPGDMQFFKKTTIKSENIQFRNMMIMGRVTWESIPEAHRPLLGRKNVVITRNKNFVAGPDVSIAHSIDQAIKAIDDRVADIFVIGGAKIFEQFMKKQKIHGIYLTRIKQQFKCDTFFPRIPKAFKPEKLGEGKDGDVSYEFYLYKKKK